MKITCVKTPIKPIVTVSGLYTVHYFNYGKKFVFDGEQHDFWEIIYIDRGTVSIIAEDKKFDLNRGEVYFHKPNEFHAVSTTEFASAIVVSFSMTGNTDFFNDGKFKLTTSQQMLLSNIVIESAQAFSDAPDELYLRKMTPRQDAPIGATQLIRCYLENLLISLMRQKLDITLTKASSDAELTLQIKRYLSNHLYDSITLSELSKQMFFSTTYLSAKFKQDTGMSILAYFNKMKIDEAKRLISSEQYSLTQIATMLGYGSSQYFTRIFKKSTHSTPSEWAKSTKLDNILR